MLEGIDLGYKQLIGMSILCRPRMLSIMVTIGVGNADVLSYLKEAHFAVSKTFAVPDATIAAGGSLRHQGCTAGKQWSGLAVLNYQP